MTFYEKIKLLRSKYELTQKEISKLLNVSTRSYISWEKGESLPRDLRVYLELTKIFSVSLSYLLQGISDDKEIGKAIDDNDNITNCLNYISELSIIFQDKKMSFEDRLLLEESIEKMYLDIKFKNYILKKNMKK